MSALSTQRLGPTGNEREDIRPGDIVAVKHGNAGRKEGLVVGSHVDYLGRTILEIQIDPLQHIEVWYPTVTRVRRTISYSGTPQQRFRPGTTIERHVYWQH